MTVRKREYKNRNGQQIWDYDFWFNGQRYRKAGFVTKAQAELAETKARHLVISGKTITKSVTFADLAETFLQYRQGRVAENTLRNDRNRIKNMLPTFGEKRVQQIGVANIESYLCTRRDQGIAPQTLNHAINILGSFFQFAIDHGHVHDSPMKRIKRFKVLREEPVIPSDTQFRTLVECAYKTEVGLELATWLTFRGYTGTRPTESFFMEWSDVDFDRNQITIRPKLRNGQRNELKAGEKRVLPLHPELKDALKTWQTEWERKVKKWERKAKKAVTHDWIFIHPRYSDRRCSRFERSYPRAQELAGLTERMTSHCLRHVFISKAVESGVNILALSRWVGHSGTKMIEKVYAHLSPEFRNNEMQKLQLGLTPSNETTLSNSHNGQAEQAEQEKIVDSKVA